LFSSRSIIITVTDFLNEFGFRITSVFFLLLGRILQNKGNFWNGIDYKHLKIKSLNLKDQNVPIKTIIDSYIYIYIFLLNIYTYNIYIYSIYIIYKYIFYYIYICIF